MNSPLILSYNDYSRANAEKKEKVKYGGSNLKVYIFLADGFEEIEGLTVVDIMRRAKIDVETISITGQKQINGAHKIIVEADRLFEETDFSDGDMLVLPGGMPGTLNLKEHEGLRNLIGEFDKKKKYLAAICAAPSILSELGILKGRKACAYPSFEEGLDCAQVVHEAAVTDGHVTTGRGMGAAIPFALKLTELLCGTEKANEVCGIYRICIDSLQKYFSRVFHVCLNLDEKILEICGCVCYTMTMTASVYFFISAI